VQAGPEGPHEPVHGHRRAGGGLTHAADGNTRIENVAESGSGRLNIVLNWFDELKRLAPTGK
jgi:hypothetical protein